MNAQRWKDEPTERQRARLRSDPARIERIRSDIWDNLTFAPDNEMRGHDLRKKVPTDPGAFYAVVHDMVTVGELTRRIEKKRVYYRLRPLAPEGEA